MQRFSYRLAAVVCLLALWSIPASALARGASSRGSLQPHITNLNALRIPDSSWPHGHGSISTGSLAVQSADADGNAFRQFHKLSYADAGMQGGLYQQTGFTTDEGGAGAGAYWLGSTYSSPDGAARMMNDAISTGAAAGFVPQPCYLPSEPDCRLFVFPIMVGGGRFLDVLYAVWTRGDVLGEVAVLCDYRTAAHTPAAIGGGVQTILQGAATVVDSATTGASATGEPPPSTPPTITINGFNVMHQVRGALKETTSVRLHETVFFFATFHVSAIGVYGPDGHFTAYFPRGHLALLKDGKVIYNGHADFSTAPDSTPYFASIGTVDKQSATGTLDARFTLSIGEASSSRSVQVTVKSATKHKRKGR